MSLCIGFGCRRHPRDGFATCATHCGLEPLAPPCPDGHGELAFVVLSAVYLGGSFSLMYACPSCDYVTQVRHPPTPAPDPAVVERARRRGGHPRPTCCPRGGAVHPEPCPEHGAQVSPDLLTRPDSSP